MTDDATSEGTTGGASGQTATQANAAATKTTKEAPETFTRDQVESMKSAAINEVLKKEREKHAELLAAKDKDADTKIKELAAKNEEATAYADFVEAATAAGVRNSKAAYLVAKHGGYLDKGRFDLKTFAKDNPEFFAPPTTANAGAGAGATQRTGGMNEYIRAAAGVPT